MKTPLGILAVLTLTAGCATSPDAGYSGPYFPPPEDQGGWRTLLPAKGDPDAAQKAKILETAGVDWDKLQKAWEFNITAEGATQLLVIRKGQIVGEWSKGCERTKAFNIYSSS